MDQYLDMLVAASKYDILQLKNLVRQNPESFAQLKFVEFMLDELHKCAESLTFMYYGDDNDGYYSRIKRTYRTI